MPLLFIISTTVILIGLVIMLVVSITTMEQIRRSIDYFIVRLDFLEKEIKKTEFIDKTDKVVGVDIIPAGVITRPTAQDIAKRNEPKRTRETKEAIKESLDNVPELQEAKKYIKKIKGYNNISTRVDDPYEG